MADERKPCPGCGLCCTRPLFDRTMFPCDPTAELWRRVLSLEAENKRLRARVAELEAGAARPAAGG